MIDEAEQKVIKCVAKWQNQGFDLDQICQFLESGECTLELEQKDTLVESEIKEVLQLIQTGELDRYRTVRE